MLTTREAKLIGDEVFGMIGREQKRQAEGIELIASENFVSKEVLLTMGTCLTNKYAEGLPGKRYYGGCHFVDEVENLARDRAKQLFSAEWVNVQPHSGSQANAAVMLALLKPGDTILGFDLSHGGHLTHGSPVNFSGQTYRAVFYQVSRETGLIDYAAMEQKAKSEKPRLIIAGASAYSRDWDYARMKSIADSCGAFLMADISHPAGLIAAGLLNDPLPHCDAVTTTTHKTLRGPRGGMVMIGRNGENKIGAKTLQGKLKTTGQVLDGAVFPGTQGGPLMHVIAAKAVAFGEALRPEFKDYCRQVIINSKALASDLTGRGYHVVSGGTDNHMFLLDLRNRKITGKEAENALVAADITVNKNMVPFDDQSPFVTSGIRIGTAAVTTRGFREPEIAALGEMIDRILSDIKNESLTAEIRSEVRAMMAGFTLNY